MKKYLLICMVSLMALCMSGCSEDISEFNIFEYGYNFVENKIEENRKKSEDAVDQMKENAEDALDEAIDGYVGILKKRQKKRCFCTIQRRSENNNLYLF